MLLNIACEFASIAGLAGRAWFQVESAAYAQYGSPVIGPIVLHPPAVGGELVGVGDGVGVGVGVEVCVEVGVGDGVGLEDRVDDGVGDGDGEGDDFGVSEESPASAGAAESGVLHAESAHRIVIASRLVESVFIFSPRGKFYE